MTVLLILAMFALFIAIEYFTSRQREATVAAKPATKPARPRPEIVAGFQLPDHLLYHPGHTWAASEGVQLVRVGLDDFAARLIGSVQRFELPARGKWIRQGQKIIAAYRDGSKAEIVSPIEGMVTDVNDAVLREPELARRDPYGEGWLLTVQSPDAKVNFRNLLFGNVARRWMEEAAIRLRGRLPGLAGAVAQDGGIAVANLAAQIPEQTWKELTEEFFLT